MIPHSLLVNWFFENLYFNEIQHKSWLIDQLFLRKRKIHCLSLEVDFLNITKSHEKKTFYSCTIFFFLQIRSKISQQPRFPEIGLPAATGFFLMYGYDLTFYKITTKNISLPKFIFTTWTSLKVLKNHFGCLSCLWLLKMFLVAIFVSSESLTYRVFHEKGTLSFLGAQG